MLRISFIAKALTFALLIGISLRTSAFQKDVLFASEAPLDLEIVTNFKLLKGSKSDTVFFPTFIKFKNQEGKPDSVPVNLRGRGNSRRAQCFFPPLWIKIPKGSTKNTPFEGNRSLKLVLPCQEGDSFNQLIVKEYIAYKLYEQVSPYFFQTRLINLTLTDRQNKKGKTYALTAFVLEDVDNVADNYKAKTKDSGLILPQFVNDTLALKQDFFAFMIGNTDWSNTSQHNVKMLDTGKGKFIPVPYDFDYSGFVNAPYAVPYDYLPITKVTERLYRGICRNEVLTQLVKSDFLQSESQILATLEKYKSLLPSSEFESSRNYLMDFFSILKNETAFQTQLASACQKYNLVEN
ncbi:hypothetical protein CLV31_111139 [Algoriphagus aquaeductus]|uniref:CotH protein n=1 Tax=Algoriphagus aquaeductus TaxID=475299 RepID=A0A326RRU5_9BACT|nr:hypothetical protein [Algoriphagus aquaeductus]PZV80972.1 hypothetical protein CLV31_111139 [Algoriphagus aquaeductus]